MLQKITIEGVNFPRLYMAEDSTDVRVAKENGIPYVRWSHGLESLIKQLLRPTLEKMFPGIVWDQVLGRRKKFNPTIQLCSGSEVESDIDYNSQEFDNDKMVEAQHEYDKTYDDRLYDHDVDDLVFDPATERREFCSTASNKATFVEKMKLEDYIGDLTSSVNIDVLQKLNLLPKFLGDIVDCIKVNLSNNMRWMDGYNKKLGVPLGRFGSSKCLPNLIILDISGSIPRGISATMLTLIDTMRTQLDADLIITSDRSVFYSRESELPKPQTLRNYFGFGNEAAEFYAILKKHVFGREWGHVISFGDNDSPERYKHYDESIRFPDPINTKIHAVHHYHTGYSFTNDFRTGYALWCHDVNSDVEEHYDQSWCNCIRK